MESRMKLLVKPITTREEFHKKLTPELLEQMGLLEESLDKISLADKLEGKTKQYMENNYWTSTTTFVGQFNYVLVK